MRIKSLFTLHSSLFTFHSSLSSSLFRGGLGRGFFILLLFYSFTSFAQDDFGVWGDISAEHKFSRKLSVGIEGEYRSRDNAGETDRCSGGISADYKLMKHLKAGAGYVFICENEDKTKNYDEEDGGGLKWKETYWQPRHRFYLQLTGDYDLGRFNISLRERWQYTHRPASTKTVTRSYYTPAGDFNYDDEKELDITAKDKNALRSRLQVAYDIHKCPVTPYCSIEFTNAWSLTKTRYTIGTDWKISSRHELGLQYFYQNINGDDDDDDVNSHVISLSYKVRF